MSATTIPVGRHGRSGSSPGGAARWRRARRRHPPGRWRRSFTASSLVAGADAFGEDLGDRGRVGRPALYVDAKFVGRAPARTAISVSRLRLGEVLGLHAVEVRPERVNDTSCRQRQPCGLDVRREADQGTGGRAG